MSIQQTPADLSAYINEQGITARLVTNIGPTPTVTDAATALGVGPNQIVKTLLFQIKPSLQPDGQPLAGGPPKLVVIIGCGENHIDKKKLAKHFGVGAKKVKMASAETVLELIGYPAGGVPPFGHRTALPMLMDASVVASAKEGNGILFGGGGDAQTMLEITLDELVRVTEPTVVALS